MNTQAIEKLSMPAVPPGPSKTLSAKAAVPVSSATVVTHAEQ
jgi:hypothetical protein